MNRRTIIICISALAVLVALVICAVGMLYSGGGETKPVPEEEIYDRAVSARPLLCTVPSDAAMILYAPSFRSAVEVLEDSTSIVGTLFSGTGRTSFGKYLKSVGAMLDDGMLGSVKNSECVLSMHYSGDLVPVMTIVTGKLPSDSVSGVWKMISEADSAGISSSVVNQSSVKSSALKKKNILIFSSSEPLVRSCERHIAEGESVLKNTNCAALASRLADGVSFFINNEYSGKLGSSFLSREFRKYTGFLKNYAGWTGFTMTSSSWKGVSLTGTTDSYASPAFYSNSYKALRPGVSTVAGILPSGTLTVSSMQIADVDASVAAYAKYIDAGGKSADNKYEAALLKKRTGVAPDVWAKSLEIKEVARATVPVGGGYEPVLLVRPGKTDPALIFKGLQFGSMKDYDGSVNPNAFRGYAANLFGGLFSAPDSMFVFSDGWIVAGSRDATSSFVGMKKRNTLEKFLSEAGLSYGMPADGTVFQSYYAVSAAPETLGDVFSKDVAASARRMLDGVSLCAAFFTVRPGNDLSLSFDLARVEFAGGVDEVPAMTRDTTVNVPTGPFKVKNCGTGKTNLFSQQPNNYLVLKEEDGKGIWGVPFKAPICGAVSEIDYFGNGKIQFLFASGSSLYLIDRLGRFVKPFPVDLGKEILIGPAAYDFTGAHGYTAVVLHKDNTIGMYDLHGKAPSSWKGIKSEETIKSLPELLRVKGKRFWVVRTSVRTVVYGFDGGNPVYNPDGNKMIRPDAKVNVNDNGSVTALCYDGKERALKL